MTAVVITPSVDRSWVRPLATLGRRGVASVVITLDGPSYAAVAASASRSGTAQFGADVVLAGDVAYTPATASSHGADPQQVRALRHALAEYDLRTYSIGAGIRLAEVLA